MTSIGHHHLRCGAVQVVVPPLRQVLAADVDVAHCTQIPVTNAPTGLKRMRKERRSKALASGGGETTPKPQRPSRSRKVTSAECGLADMTLQTPMPASDAPNELGPPPPDSTPAPKHGISCDDSTPDNTWASVAVALQAVCGYPVYYWIMSAVGVP